MTAPCLFIQIYKKDSENMSKDYFSKQYSKIDINVKSNFTGNPFDKNICCSIKKPNGTEFTIKAFYNGENNYISRVYTDEIGMYSYNITEENKTLESGEINCEKSTENYLHGKLVKSSDNKKAVYADGTAYNMLGFEVDWLFLLDDEEKDFPKARVLIDTINKYKFNMTVVSLYARNVTWAQGIGGYNTQYDFSDPKQGPFLFNGDETDFSMLDVEFFKRVDKIMEHMLEKEIVCHLMIYVWNKFVTWPKLFSQEDNRFYSYVIDRYQAYPNLIWDVSKEALSYGTVTSDDIYNKCKYVKENDVYGTLTTVHDSGFCSKHSDVIDIHSTQNWEFSLQQGMLDIINQGKNNIICNVEHGGYEKGIFDGFHGAYDDPIVCLERNYICMFLGLYTVYYWQNTSWNIVVWDMESLSERNRPKLHYYKYMAEYMERIKFDKLRVCEDFKMRKFVLEDDEFYYIMKPTGMKYITFWKLNAPIGSEIEWFRPLENEYVTTILTEFDRTYGVPSPWDNEIAVAKIKKP